MNIMNVNNFINYYLQTKLNAAVSDENKLNSLKAENNILKQTLAGNAKRFYI